MKRIATALEIRCLALSVALAMSWPAGAAEHSVYFYGLKDVTADEWSANVVRWSREGLSRITVSLEAGREFLLNDPAQTARLSGFFRLAAAHGLRIEGMVLQDPSWALTPMDARRRLRKVLTFAAGCGCSLDSVQIDVEVYTAPKLFGGREWERFTDLVSALRLELNRGQSTVRFNAALPWWIYHGASEVQLRRIAAAIDAAALMSYGDENGVPVAADEATFRRKVYPSITALAVHGIPFRVGVAKYEHRSGASMAQFVSFLDRLFPRDSGYQGISCFHDGSNFLAAAARVPGQRRGFHV